MTRPLPQRPTVSITTERTAQGLVAGIDQRRIAQELRQIARIGALPGGGVSRLAYTPEEREAHSLVGRKLAELGLSVRVDAAGNTFGRRAGQEDRLPVIAFGSHIDSVYGGGNFDGVVGVVGALEVIRVFNEQGIETRHPLLVVVFAAEEGARFGAPHLGSRAMVGDLSLEEVRRLRDGEGVSLYEALKGAGFNPEDLSSAVWDRKGMAAVLELHIEQARVLQTLGKPIGIVEAVSGATRLRVHLQGRVDHSGATPMNLRRDALAAAAEVILNLERIAKEEAGRFTVATVGKLRVSPGVITVVPGEVEMDVDVRDIDGELKERTVALIETMIGEVCRRRDIRPTIEVLTDQRPAPMPIWTRETIRAVCRELELSYRVMPSGAGHDARVLCDIAPAGMILIPSKDGISHDPAEWSEISDIALGIQVLANTILRLDESLSQRGPGLA